MRPKHKAFCTHCRQVQFSHDILQPTLVVAICSCSPQTLQHSPATSTCMISSNNPLLIMFPKSRFTTHFNCYTPFVNHLLKLCHPSLPSVVSNRQCATISRNLQCHQIKNTSPKPSYLQVTMITTFFLFVNSLS